MNQIKKIKKRTLPWQSHFEKKKKKEEHYNAHVTVKFNSVFCYLNRGARFTLKCMQHVYREVFSISIQNTS